MQSPVKFHCQQCHAGLTTDRESIGLSCECPSCKTMLTVPTPMALVRLQQADDEYEFDIDLLDNDGRLITSTPNRLPSSIGPVELKMPGNLGSLKTQVDQPTSNAMATTFLGGLLVVVGAMLFAMFGGKSRSA